MTPIEFYNNYQQSLNDNLKKVKSKIALLGLTRLIVFVGLAYYIYTQWKSFNVIDGLIILIGVVIFIWLVKVSANAQSLKEAILAQIKVIKNELDQKTNGNNFFSNGDQLKHFNSTTYDLDLFGEKSAFHYINRTHTQYGNEELSNRIIHSNLNIDSLQVDQLKVKAFSDLPAMNIELAAYYRMEEDKSILKNMQDWIQDNSIRFTTPKVNFLKWLAPILSAILISISIYTESFLWASIPLFIFLPIASRIAIKGLSLQQKISAFEIYINKYTSFLESFIKHSDGIEVLKSEHTAAVEAFKDLKKLHAHLEMFESTNNILVKLFLNGYLFYEIHCLAKIEKWKLQHQHSFKDWEHLLGKIEYYVSLGTYAFNHPNYTYPSFVTGKLKIETKEAVHPLMLENAVSNDFSIGIQEQMVLLTGSNMSGKTTFLRTIGVNVIIGQLGAPVAATYFNYTPLRVYTSIRVSDSLQENTSYFKAELNQLKDIIDQIKEQQEPILVLIDEILKGTNSEDKTNGSAAYMKQLMSYDCLCIFATHDLVLSHLEESYPNKMKNYCFESVIENNQLLFNYKIQTGVAKNKNASFLMKLMGIIE